jgi:hypothetical protein
LVVREGLEGVNDAAADIFAVVSCIKNEYNCCYDKIEFRDRYSGEVSLILIKR